MKVSHLIFLFYIFFAFLVCSGCLNNKEKDSASDLRIISLAPHITEIVYALNAQKQLIAVSDYCNYPIEATTKHKIGGLLNPNIEKILSLNPTHIFGLPSHEKLNQDLEKFGLTITMMSNENISDVLHTISTIGSVIDREEQSNQLVNHIKNRLDTFKFSRKGNSFRATLMIGREKGTLRNITVAGNDTYIDEIWKQVGGENSYTDLPTRYGTINLESLLLRDPDVIIEFDMKRSRGVYRREITSEWKYLESLRAVKNRNIFIIGGNHTMIPGPRLVLLAEDFSEISNMVRDTTK